MVLSDDFVPMLARCSKSFSLVDAITMNSAQSKLLACQHRNYHRLHHPRLRLDLLQPRVSEPVLDLPFEKNYSMNVIQFWKEQVAVFR